MSIKLQPPIPLISLIKTEPPTVIKNEPPEDALEKEISPDIKDIDVVYHSLSEHLIKSETVSENILDTKYSESVEKQVLVKAENSPFIQADNITQRNKTEDTSDENVTRGTGQEVIKVQGSHKHSNTLSNLETQEQLVLNSSKHLNGIGTKIRKAKYPKKTNFAKCYKTVKTTSWKKDKDKIKIIKAPVIPVKPHEYTSLPKDKHICNHCQHAYNKLKNVKIHIRKMHRKVTTMYQCPYCLYKSRWNINNHIILKHKDTKEIQWFQCHLCEKKYRLKSHLTGHMKVHLKYKQMQDGLYLKRYHCNNCDYKTDNLTTLKRHKLVHLKPEEIEYFYCYHCSYKCQRKDKLQSHIFRHFKNVEFKQGKRHDCNKCDYNTYHTGHLKRHKLIHLNSEDIPYFHCYHCSYKSKQKVTLQTHIFKHLKNGEVKFDCYICNFMTQKSESIMEHIKNHSKVQIKLEINEGS